VTTEGIATLCPESSILKWVTKPFGAEAHGQRWIAATDGRLLVAVHGEAEPAPGSASADKFLAMALKAGDKTTVPRLRAFVGEYEAEPPEMRPGWIWDYPFDRNYIARALDLVEASGPAWLRVEEESEALAIRGLTWLLVLKGLRLGPEDKTTKTIPAWNPRQAETA